jgi:putative oxidoreductase
MESILTKILRILVGLLLVFAGMSKLIPMAPPPPHNEAATAFMGALVATGYMMPIIAVVEVICGLCFLSGRFVALAAVMLVPISLNIVLFHTLLDPSGALPGLFVAAVNVYLLAVSFPKYQDMLMPR